MRGQVGDALVDRFFRRPTGVIARYWWRDMRPHHEIFRDTLRVLELRQDDRLLEVGCGGGTFLSWALESGCTAAAVDHSADMVRLTRKNNATAVAEGHLEVREGAGERLPFEEGSFTCAAMMNVLFFLDAALALREVRRVLSPEGRVVISTVAAESASSVAPSVLVRRMRLHTNEELTGLLDSAGFTDIAIDQRGKGKLRLVMACCSVAD